MESNPSGHYNRNISLLQRFHPDAYNKVMAIASPPESPPRRSSGDALPERKEPAVVLSEDSPQEIANYLQRIPADIPTVVIFIGMGPGQIPAALVKARSSIRHLLIFEYFPEIFLQALHSRDLSGLLSDSRLIIGLGDGTDAKHVLQPAGKAMQLEHIHILRHLPSFHNNLEEYQRLQDIVYEEVNSFNIAGSTLIKMGKRFMANRFENLTSMPHNRLLENLKNTFSGIPAILVASGPSLDQNVHLLQDAQDKAVIIAIDSALPTLLAHGVKPHFVTALDPDDVIYEKIAACAGQADGINLICQLGVAPKIHKIFPASQVFWAFNDNPQTRWLNALLGGRMSIGATHSNAHLNLLSAIIMDTSTIIYIGQDLAFTSNKSHGDHVVLKEDDTWKKRLQDQDDTIWTESIHGEKIPTHRGFYASKLLFEEIMSHHPGRYINATAAGVHLEGAEAMPLEVALKRYCPVRHEIRKKIQTAIDTSLPPATERLVAEFQTYLTQTKELHSLTRKAKENIKKISSHLNQLQKNPSRYRNFKSLPASLYNLIVDTDRLNGKIDGAKNIWELMVEHTMQSLKESERLQDAINLLANQPANFLDWLEKSFERLNYLNNSQDEALPELEQYLHRICEHYQSEVGLQETLRTAGDTPELLLRLAELYYSADDFVLLHHILPRMAAMPECAARLAFYQGCIAALWDNLAESERYFSEALTRMPALAEEIDHFRMKQCEVYAAYAETYKDIDRATTRMLSMKGLGFMPESQALQETLQEMLTADMQEFQESLTATGAHDSDAASLGSWLKEIDSNPLLRACFSTEQHLGLNLLYGGHLTAKENHDEAITCLRNALKLAPRNPQIHIALTDAFFALGNFVHGIEHLRAAVAEDASYAGYWAVIGDLLQQATLHQEAIAAYEQGITSGLSDNGLLKKMGDSYLAMGQHEAAHEAYLQFKVRHINSSGSLPL